MLIACSCNVDDYIAVDAELGQWLWSSHIDSFAWEAILVWRKRRPEVGRQRVLGKDRCLREQLILRLENARIKQLARTEARP